MDNKLFSKWMDDNLDAMIQDIISVVNIKSVSIPGSTPFPYGDGCKEVLDKCLEISERMGFSATNHEEHCGTVLLKGESEDELAIFGHLDIVPEGTGWSTDPYNAVVSDGKIIGRGAQDNKGPAIIALYTAKFIKDAGIKLNHSLRIFFGLSEEKGMDDVLYYISKNPMPKFSIVPDAPFPVCTGEKGILALDMIGNAGNIIKEMNAAEVSNMVPSDAYVVLDVDYDKAQSMLSPYMTDEFMTEKTSMSKIKLSAKGRSGHAAWPELADSALVKLYSILSKSGILDEAGQKSVDFLLKSFSDYDGAGINTSFKDDFGRLTHIGGMVRIENEKIVQNINIRYPVKTDRDSMKNNIKAHCESGGFDFRLLADDPPFFIDPKSPVIQMMQSVCNEVLEKDYEPYVMGFTYARKLKNAVAFGPCLPDKFNAAHQPNEFVEINDLINGIKVYAKVLLELDKML